MEKLTGKWALITGASSGFGIDFAHALAERGANLILVARRQEPMQQLAATISARHNVAVELKAADLALPGSGLALKQHLDQKKINVDILINNAGCGLYGPFVEQPLAATLDMLQLNILSLTELTHLFASSMIQRGGGHILLVASIGGYQATPTYAAYGASKAYVLLFGEALHEELKPHKVKLSVLSPGVSATGFLAAAGQRTTPYQRLFMMQSRPVVDAGLAALFCGKPSVIPGLGNKLTIFGNRLAPRSLQSKIAYQLMKN